MYFEVVTPFGVIGPNGNSVDLLTKDYLAAVIVSSSGLSSRVRMENSTAAIISYSASSQNVPKP